MSSVSSHTALLIRVALRRDALTRELAEGAHPDSSPELGMRAGQLNGERTRRQLARTLRRTIAEAHQPPMARSRIVVIQRGAVLDAEAALGALFERLESPAPVSAQGVAIAQLLITEAHRSPLYNPAEPGTLRRRVLVATTALEVRPSGDGELPLAA